MPNGLGWLDFIMATLATYRLAQFISKDDGPLDIFKRLRLHARKLAGYHQGVMTNGSLPEGERFIASRLFITWKNIVAWLECPYCNGVWFSAACLLLVQVHPIGWWIVAWLAVAGGQAFLQGVNQ
jgi:hypothetical protein